ncbi:iron uptake system protein EfeO [Shimazuella kribbensis]|uniref:iron uptake system protein EfeO n=1 Tax=Shimazuella kribbensis TaxID=139808 RepID=UPI0003F73579|nr:iron uptake system protein EfeO [Shimazuella kribbensis]
MYVIGKRLLVLGLVFTVAIGCTPKEDISEKKPTTQTQTKPDPALQQVVNEYRKFVIEQMDQLVQQTELFSQAIKTGDLEKAKQLYAPTRMYYERIEPIAESLGDLDPKIDARENDVPAANWSGFHKLEKALWQEKNVKGQELVADQLLKDVQFLRAKVETVEIDPNLLITGSVELLNEVSASKVTGEEERYSHTDLYDFVANVEGSKEIFVHLKPLLEKKDAKLATDIDAKFTALQNELTKYKKGDGYVLYGELRKDQVKTLSQLLDALAEPLSRIGTVVGGV